MSRRLRLTIDDGHGRPRLTEALVDSLVTQLEPEQAAAYVTIEGVASGFCEGMDLGAFSAAPDQGRRALQQFAALLRAITKAPRPVVALVNGAALGGGVGIVAAADVVLAGSQATFALPEALFGLIPATVLPYIARRVGVARARWLAISTQTISAADALRFGLVDEVVDDLEAALTRYARRFELLDPRSIADIKELTAALAPTAPADAEVRLERLLASVGTRERIARFLEGDTPWPDTGAR